MKMILLSIYVQHTAIMPQVNNNVDNNCNTVIMKYVWKKALKKQTLITVPVNSFITQSFSQQLPDRRLGYLYAVEDHWLSEWTRNNTPLGLFSSLFPLTFKHSLHFLRVCSHEPLLVEKYIHIFKKSTMYNDHKRRHEVQTSSSAFKSADQPQPALLWSLCSSLQI